MAVMTPVPKPEWKERPAVDVSPLTDALKNYIFTRAMQQQQRMAIPGQALEAVQAEGGQYHKALTEVAPRQLDDSFAAIKATQPELAGPSAPWEPAKLRQGSDESIAQAAIMGSASKPDRFPLMQQPGVPAGTRGALHSFPGGRYYPDERIANILHQNPAYAPGYKPAAVPPIGQSAGGTWKPPTKTSPKLPVVSDVESLAKYNAQGRQWLPEDWQSGAVHDPIKR